MRMAAAISHYTIGRILMEDVQSASSTIEKAHQQMQKLPWLPAPILAELDRTKSQVAALHREVHCYQETLIREVEDSQKDLLVHPCSQRSDSISPEEKTEPQSNPNMEW